MDTHIRTFFFHTTKDRDRFCQHKYTQTADDQNHFRNHTKLFDIVNRFIFSASPNTLSNNRHQPNANSDCCNSIQIFQNTRHCLCRDCHCAER